MHRLRDFATFKTSVVGTPLNSKRSWRFGSVERATMDYNKGARSGSRGPWILNRDQQSITAKLW